MLLGKPSRNQRPVWPTQRLASFFSYTAGIRVRQPPSGAPVMPVNPPTRTQNLSAVGSTDHASYHRRPKLSLSSKKTRGTVCVSISLGHAGPRGYLIWDDMWGSCRRLDGVRADLRKTKRFPLARVFFFLKKKILWGELVVWW